jgi:hypothetical protein
VTKRKSKHKRALLAAMTALMQLPQCPASFTSLPFSTAGMPRRRHREQPLQERLPSRWCADDGVIPQAVVIMAGTSFMEQVRRASRAAKLTFEPGLLIQCSGQGTFPA